MAETCRAFEVGVSLSSEEQGPAALVRVAHRAEELGFGFAMISDHFHPWIDQQGQSPFVWSVLGAIAQATERLRVGTAVTCPLIRIHPVVLAQAAATTSVLMEGRFLFGVGTGENLNEHVVGAGRPHAAVRTGPRLLGPRPRPGAGDRAPLAAAGRRPGPAPQRAPAAFPVRSRLPPGQAGGGGQKDRARPGPGTPRESAPGVPRCR